MSVGWERDMDGTEDYVSRERCDLISGRVIEKLEDSKNELLDKLQNNEAILKEVKDAVNPRVYGNEKAIGELAMTVKSNADTISELVEGRKRVPDLVLKVIMAICAGAMLFLGILNLYDKLGG